MAKATAKEPIWRSWPLSRASLPETVAKGLSNPETAKKLPDGKPIETLGELADLVAKSEDPVAVLCELPSVGTTRAQEAIDLVSKLVEAFNATRSMHPDEREAVAGSRRETARKARKEKKRLLLEVKPNRTLNWPIRPFPVRAETGERVWEDDPLIDPTPETIAALKEAGIAVEAGFNQTHKLWVAEEEDQEKGPTPVNLGVGARMLQILGFDVPIGELARPKRVERTREQRAPRRTPPPASVPDGDDEEVPEVDAADDVERVDAAMRQTEEGEKE